MKKITKAQLETWLDGLAESCTLAAPVDVQDKIFYKEVKNSADIAWGNEQTDMSIKTWIFPDTESILTIEQEAEKVAINDAPPPAPKVVFGVRPCDARGVLAIDALFLGQEPSDGQYARHREATTLIGLACPQMWENCFCTVVGGAPDGTDGLDILLYEVEGGYAAQIISEKGAALAADLPGVEQDLTPPPPKLTEGLPKLKASAEWKEKFNDEFWQKLGDRCLGCRSCTFVCPACRCFDVRDEVVSHKPGKRVFERLRAWDACTMSAYRRIAGGHNSRPTQAVRLRNRFYCKFMYYPDDFGPLGCVGCGRCIQACPVNIDILEIVTSMANGK